MLRSISPRTLLVCIGALLAATGCQQDSPPKSTATIDPVKSETPVVTLETTAGEAANPSAAITETQPEPPDAVVAEPPMEPPPEVEGLQRLGQEFDVWLDLKGKRVFVGGKIVRNEGQLE